MDQFGSRTQSSCMYSDSDVESDGYDTEEDTDRMNDFLQEYCDIYKSPGTTRTILAAKKSVQPTPEYLTELSSELKKTGFHEPIRSRFEPVCKCLTKINTWADLIADRQVPCLAKVHDQVTDEMIAECGRELGKFFEDDLREEEIEIIEDNTGIFGEGIYQRVYA